MDVCDDVTDADEVLDETLFGLTAADAAELVEIDDAVDVGFVGVGVLDEVATADVVELLNTGAEVAAAATVVLGADATGDEDVVLIGLLFFRGVCLVRGEHGAFGFGGVVAVATVNFCGVF